MKKYTEAECLCQRCKQNYMVWHTPSDLWNKYIDPFWNFLCPTCFCFLAEISGCKTLGWVIVPSERFGEDAPAEGTDSACIIEAAKTGHYDTQPTSDNSVSPTCSCAYHKIGSVEKGVRENNPLCPVHGAR